MVVAEIVGTVSDLVLRTLLFSGLVGMAFSPLEQLFTARRPGRLARPGFRTDLAFSTFGAVAVRLGIFLGLGVALSAVDLFAVERPLWGHVESAGLRNAANVVSGLLLFEVAGYAYHRLAHRVPVLWRLHRVHHSSESMDWLASFRQHPLEIILMTLVQNVPLVLLGVPLGSHAMVLLLLRIHTVYVHANLRSPRTWWTHIVATPRFHHRHHQRLGAPLNYASLFPFLDRLFGTYSCTDADEFGLPTPAPRSFLGLLLLK